MTSYPIETLSEDDDDGTMPDNVAFLAEAVVGHRIVSVAHGAPSARRLFGNDPPGTDTVITLDNGQTVTLVDTDDCCAYTEVREFLLHPDKVNHLIMGVGTTDEYQTWHIYADLGDILELTVGWSCGNPFYYGYGFDIIVGPA